MSKFEDTIISLIKDLIGTISLKREVPVKKLFPEFPSGRERYDIVLPVIKTIIECHGAQHEKLVSFGTEDPEQTYKRLIFQKGRDRQKEEIAWKNGWTYICIWYDELSGKKSKDLLLLEKKFRQAAEREN